jgi:hypothetical protein
MSQTTIMLIALIIIVIVIVFLWGYTSSSGTSSGSGSFAEASGCTPIECGSSGDVESGSASDNSGS